MATGKRTRRTKLQKLEEDIKELSIKDKMKLIESIKAAAQEEHKQNQKILSN